MKDSELSLRIRGLLELEKKRMIKRKKKARWAEYLVKPVPVICVNGSNRAWIQRLKEKVKNNLEL